MSEMKRIRYKKRRRYKYTLDEPASFVCPQLNITARGGVNHYSDECVPGVLSVARGDELYIYSGYSWDGPSGPTIDTSTFMRGSLVHDALYQLMRLGVLPQSYRKTADEILRDVCLQDDMSRARAWYVYRCVRMFGGKSARGDLLTAPSGK